MTEISEAAKRKARELAPGHNFIECDAVDALARVLQEHSDVAKDVARYLAPGSIFEPTLDRLHRDSLQSLILPDEPCEHANFGSTLGGGWACRDCGKALKIVEAGDD